MQESFNDKEVFNIAADAEVNQYIDVLPKDAIDIKDIDPMLPPKAGTKYYYEYLYKDKKDSSGGRKTIIIERIFLIYQTQKKL